MPMNPRLAALQRKHAEAHAEVEALRSAPSAQAHEVVPLKRKKLRLKTQIDALGGETITR